MRPERQKRKDFMVFWIVDGSDNVTGKENLEIIGKGVEDMPISMNAETEESQDVLGKQQLRHHRIRREYDGGPAECVRRKQVRTED